MPGELTIDTIVDRVRSICVSSPFAFKEAVSWDTFELQPSGNVDGVFRIPPPSSQFVHGGFSFIEDRVDSMQIWVARKRNANYDAVRQALLNDVHSLTGAVVRDGAQTSGDYDVRDGGRGHSIFENAGQEYVTLRLTLPVNYIAQL
jgi:hypothetical protein